MQVLRVDVYGNISTLNVEFDQGQLTNCEKLFKCELCPFNPEVHTHRFLEGYLAHFCTNLVHSDICDVPTNPFSKAFLDQEQYRGYVYISKILEHNCTIIPCNKEDIDTISQYISDFQNRFATKKETPSSCAIS